MLNRIVVAESPKSYFIFDTLTALFYIRLLLKTIFNFTFIRSFPKNYSAKFFGIDNCGW